MRNINGEGERNRKLFWMLQWMRFGMLSEQEFNSLPDEDRIKGFGPSVWKYSVERERVIPIFAQHLSMFVVR